MAVQCPIWYLTLDGLPILLSSGCKFRTIHLARDMGVTTDVEAAVPAAKSSARDTRATTAQNNNALSVL